MKIFIVAAFCVLSTFGSPLIKGRNQIIGDAGEYVKIPNEFGGMKFVDVEEIQEVSPQFDVDRDTRFLIFTRFNPTVGRQVSPFDMSTVRATNFSSNRPTRVLVHGWQSNANSDINILTTGAYLRSYDVNVVVVDWGVGANNINYIASRNQVNNVGDLIANFLDNLQASGLLADFSRVSLIGHSLGAHISGAAGKRVRSGRINTIIGLDPAGPLFDASSPANRLDSSDAVYVEVIHTDTQTFGIGDPIGHADFYPNGGTGQTGCRTQSCDHNIVVNFFVETLNSERLWGRRCSTIAEMEANSCFGPGSPMGGEPSNARNNLRGIFIMPTNANSPFGVGQF